MNCTRMKESIYISSDTDRPYRVSHRIRFPDRLLGQAVEFQCFSVNSVIVFVRESGQSIQDNSHQITVICMYAVGKLQSIV